MTGNPSPPRITDTQIVSETTGSDANPMMLSLNSENPALLNDETPWNTPSHAASSGG